MFVSLPHSVGIIFQEVKKCFFVNITLLAGEQTVVYVRDMPEPPLYIRRKLCAACLDLQAGVWSRRHKADQRWQRPVT